MRPLSSRQESSSTLCREEGLDTEDIAEKFGDTPVKKLMEYISISEDSIELSYDETDACRNTGAVAFLIRCEFNN